MQDKVLVRIRIPMTELAWDALIPLDITAEQAGLLISRETQELAGWKLPVSGALWDSASGRPLQAGRTIRELGIINSTMLLLI